MRRSPTRRPTPAPLPPEAGGWIRRLSPFLRVHRRDVTLAFGMAVLGQGVSALTPVISKVVIDDVITTHQRPLAPWIFALVAVGIFGFVAAFIRRFFGGRVSLDVQFDLRNAVYERLQRLDFASHDHLRTGQLVSRASSDVGLIQTLLSLLPIVSGNLVMLVVSLAFMLWLSPPLTVVALVAVPCLAAVALRLRRTVFPASWDAQQRAAEVAGVVDEAVTGVRVVKGFGQEDNERARLAEVAAGLFRARVRLVRLQARYTPALGAIPVIAQAAVLALGGWLAIEGRISLGTLLAFSAYLVQLVAPVRMLSGVVAFGQQARAGAERLLDVLDSNPLVTESPSAETLPLLRGEVEFRDVGFAYTRDEPILDGFDLHIAPGETVALVGGSGSGKSTLALLVPRFYDVTGGAITIDGTDLREVTFDSLRGQVGVVFEESFLFSDTVRANIAYGRPEATDAEVRAAARMSESDGFIAELPDGYDTVVGERGMTLSGGQRQRIALARALITNPRILILDDATSSIDASTEQEIHATLRKVMAGRTTLLIAHRRSTLRLADRIVVVENGRVEDQGTHEELIARCQLYRQLLAGPETALAEDPLPVAETLTPYGESRLWPHSEVVGDGPKASLATAAVSRIAPGSGGAVLGTALAPTPELLAALETLPPADAEARVDVAAEEAAPPGSFRLRRFARPYRWALGVGLALVVADTLVTLLGPFLVRNGIDNGVAQDDLSALWVAAGLFLLAALGDWLLTYLYTRVTGRTAETMLFALRIRIFSHLQRLGLDYYDREMGGRIMTRMTTDVEALSQLLQQGLITAIVSLFTSVGVFVFLIVLSPPLALAASVVIPPLILATWGYRRLSSGAYRRARDSIAVVNANLQESLSGVRVAQAYSREDRNIDGFRSLNNQYLADRTAAQRLIALYFPFVQLLSDIGAAVVLGTGAVLVERGSITLGGLVAFMLYLNVFFAPIQQLSAVFDTWQQAAASMHRIDELMGTPTSTPDAERPVVVDRPAGHIRFEDVHFAYPGGTGSEALAGINLDIAPGETVALVGETGAGKSTLVKLVARFYDPIAGRVTIDGHDLRDLDMGTYRRHLGVVPQEAFLFTGTIRDNIAYGRPDATDAEVEAAAVAVGADRLVASLPRGFLTEVTERGQSLSAGQRQLIALARARLVDPAVLLLDEATSNLDLASEARVQQAMRAVASGRTTLLVAHRLPTARTADRILLIDRGVVAEQGTHEELLKLGGRYANLWDSFALEVDRSSLSPQSLPAPAVSRARSGQSDKH